MASSTTIPLATPDPFDLEIHTPANLNRGARAALLQNSPAVVNGTIGISPGPRRMAQTPSSPLNATTITAATERAKRASPISTFKQQLVSIIESANNFARERVEEYNAKLMVFQALCAKFEEAAQQFTTGPQRRFPQRFAESFLDSWKRELSSAGPAIPKHTYSSIAAVSPRTDRDRQQHGRRQTDPPHRQGQQTTIAPTQQDLRAVLTADSETRDFLVEKQADWATELGATTVETNKEWFTYVVSDFPTRLTDFHGNEVDSDNIVSNEIEIQTGLKPVDTLPSRQVSDNPLTKTLLVSFLKPTEILVVLSQQRGEKEPCIYVKTRSHSQQIKEPEQILELFNLLRTGSENQALDSLRILRSHNDVGNVLNIIKACRSQEPRPQERGRAPISTRHLGLDGKIDLAAAAVGANLAIELARSMEEEMAPLLKKHGDTLALLPKYFGAVCQSLGLDPFQKERFSDDMNFACYDIGATLLYNAASLLEAIQTAALHSERYMPCYTGKFGWYDAQRAYLETMDNRQRWAQDKAALLEVVPDITLLFELEGIPNYLDTLRFFGPNVTNALAEFHRFKEITAELLDRASLADYHQNDAKKDFKDMRKMVTVKINGVDISTASRMALNRGRRNESASRSSSFLLHNPLFCGLWIHYACVLFRQTGVRYAAKPGAVLHAVQLYTAVRQQQQEHLVPVLEWPDLDRLLAMQGLQAFFVGTEPPASLQAHFKNDCMSRGVSPANWLAVANRRKGKQGKVLLQRSRAGISELKFEAPVSLCCSVRMEKRAIAEPTRRAWNAEVMQQILETSGWFKMQQEEQAKKDGAAETESQAGAAADRKIKAKAKAAPAHPTLTAPQLVHCFAHVIQTEMPDLVFDYFAMIKWHEGYSRRVQSMRAILPVWKTTPIAILHRESGIPPITQLLEARRYRFSARHKSLNEVHLLAKHDLPPRQPTYHQLIKRKYQAPTESSFRTRLQRTNKLLAPCPQPALMQKCFGKGQDTPLQTAPKEESAKAFLHFAIHQKDLSICDGSGRLGPAEVFDAKATGALEGLKTALNLSGSAARDIIVYLDNLAAATCLQGTPTDSLQAVFVEFQALAASHRATQVRWIPSHTDIPGNKQANKLAKAASSLPEPEGAQPTLAYLRKVARQKPKEAFKTW
ncbi:hypothetical protein F53441_2448 [Fusarium austroafricanum]|uniref:RNase H type-1 domain-containing protein n=1 Tax=Fusarium austroafricanum TaxID=2364996 RepID=A0A8H4NXT5_9HYPO|nr:hypothetical protein F53441_2448 [Fusarium austroafricanum]